MATKETKIEAYQILAANRHAHCPLHIPARQFNAVRTVMEKRFMKEYMNTPSGLYTSEQVWGQTFKSYLQK